MSEPRNLKRNEPIIFLVCFLLAFTLNALGIIRDGSPLRELVTQLPLVLLVTLILYVVVILLRILYYLISRFWVRK